MANEWRPQWGARTFVMGVINVTPDSFSGDGLVGDREGLVARSMRLAGEGADILDIGGESTRPGFTPLDPSEELERVIPAIEAITQCTALPLSIDTGKATVAQAAVERGASVINDITGLHDPDMAGVAAESGAQLLLVHNDRPPAGSDVVSFTRDGLAVLIARATAHGVAESRLMIDPGLGFGKTWRQNLELIRRLSELRSLGIPLVVGPSRKATITRVLGVARDDRLEGTEALVCVSIACGADMVRVHDCLPMVRISRVMDAVVRPR